LIDENYVNSGKARVAYWNFAFLGEESIWAAEAAECAADQDKFWEYHDKLFESQNGENQGVFTKENLKMFAAQIGLDSGKFNECLDSGKHTELVQADTALAQQIGVQSTPSFLVNGTPLIGAVPFEEFQKVIDPALSQP
jgi:protein-disulfide isomerase